QTPLEALLATIFCQVLGREQVGVDDDFFALGGDSILSIQVVARARRAGVILTVRSLFQARTVRGLAAAVQPAAPEPAAEERGRAGKRRGARAGQRRRAGQLVAERWAARTCAAVRPRSRARAAPARRGAPPDCGWRVLAHSAGGPGRGMRTGERRARHRARQ